MRLRTLRAWVGLLLGLVAVGAFARLLTWAMDTVSYNSWGALMIVPVVVAANAVIIARVNLREPDRWIRGVVVAGFVAKLFGTFARYFVTYVVYGGVGDSARYNEFAAALYFQWRQGNFLWDEGAKSGTQNLELITTAIYTVIGPSTLAGFFVFGSFAFWGAYLLLRAFRIALPEGDHRRYAVLVLLLPSLLYWPSSIGKEAWLLLMVGVTAVGAARFFSGQTLVGLIVLAVGTLGTALIRPHVTVLMIAALFFAQLTRPTGHASTSLLSKGAGVIVMAIAGIILTTQSAQFLGIDDLSWQAISDEITVAGMNTAQGGSEFETIAIEDPLGIPAALVTVLYRPFPWEADNMQLVLQSLEGVLLIILTIAALPRLKSLPGILKRHPYVVFALAYALAFILVFATFSNFGILARQRVLMFPFFFVLLALPKPPRRRRHAPPTRFPEYAYAR